MKKWRRVIISIAAIYVVIAIFLACKLTPLTKEEEFLPADHKVALLKTDQVKDFGAEQIAKIDVFMFWGV